MSGFLRAFVKIFLFLFLSNIFAIAQANTSLNNVLKSRDNFGKLPLAFEQNLGQADSTVKFLARGHGYNLFLTAQEAVMEFSKNDQTKKEAKTDSARSAANSAQPNQTAVIRTRFVGANGTPAIEGIEPLDFKANYFIGADPAQHITDVPNHARIKYVSLYPGIDAIYYGNGQNLEYDFVVAPKARPELIQLSFGGAKRISLSNKGDLVLATEIGEVIHHKPIAYQDIAGKRVAVEASYQIAKEGTIGFQLGNYDRSQVLVIDPIVTYSTFLWGTSEAVAKGVTTDSAGNVYIVGEMPTAAIPTTVGFKTSVVGYADAYIVKLDPTGTKVIYASYIGGRRTRTAAMTVAVDSEGNAYFAGRTDCALPVTNGAYQTSCGEQFSNGTGNSFVAKVNAAGNALIYCTYLNYTNTHGITADNGGNLYITGAAGSWFATTPGSFQPQLQYGGFGTVPFVAKLNATGSGMVYATFLGSKSLQHWDVSNAIATDANGNAYITGKTSSPDFPKLNAFQTTLRNGDVFVAKLNPMGTALVFSSLLGGSFADTGNSIAIDSDGQIHLGGETYSEDFPVTSNVFQGQKGFLGSEDKSGFVAKISRDGRQLIFSSFLGSSGEVPTGKVGFAAGYVSAIAVDASGFLYAAGAFPQGFPLIDSINDFGSITKTRDYSLPAVVKITPDGSQLVYSTVIGNFPASSTSSGAFTNSIVGLATTSDGSIVGLGNTMDPKSYFSTAGAPLMTGYSYLFKLSIGRYPTIMQSSANPALATQPITLSAIVQSLLPGGTVTFLNGTTTLGVASVASGQAVLTTNLPAGVHKITAVYSLDGKTSPPIFQIVNSN